MVAAVLDSHTFKNADAETKEELAVLSLEMFSGTPAALLGPLGPLAFHPRLHYNCCICCGSEGVNADGCFSYLMHYNKLSHKSVASNTATCNFSPFHGLTDVVPFLA